MIYKVDFIRKGCAEDGQFIRRFFVDIDVEPDDKLLKEKIIIALNREDVETGYNVLVEIQGKLEIEITCYGGKLNKDVLFLSLPGGDAMRHIGKYFVSKNGQLIHPVGYGTKYTSFNWDTNIIYECHIFGYHWGGTDGWKFDFSLHGPISEDLLEKNCAEITRDVYMKGVKQFFNDIASIVVEDRYIRNDKNDSDYSNVKSKVNRVTIKGK